MAMSLGVIGIESGGAAAGGAGSGTVGPGTIGTIAKFTAADTVDDSIITESGTAITITGREIITQGSIAADAVTLDSTVTWNGAGIVGPAWKLNVTDTSSNAAALLADLQVATVSKWKVDKTGKTTQTGVGLFPSGTSTAPGMAFSTETGLGWFRSGAGTMSLSGDIMRISTSGIVSIGGASAYNWYTGGAFAAINVGIAPAGASTARLEVNNGTLTTYRDLIARQLFAGGDSAAGIASSTSVTNVTDTTTTNAYVVAGGQAATTENTGWIKVYVGTAVSWIPFWTNATP